MGKSEQNRKDARKLRRDADDVEDTIKMLQMNVEGKEEYSLFQSSSVS